MSADSAGAAEKMPWHPQLNLDKVSFLILYQIKCSWLSIHNNFAQ